MFSAFNALNNPEKQEFLFLFPSEEATAQDSCHLPKVTAFNSNLPHLASNSFIFPPYSFPYTFYPLGGWVLSFLWNESESTYLLRMWNLHDYKHFWTLAWPFGPFLPKPNFEPGLPHFTQHYIQVDVYRCIRCSICVIMLSFLPPYPKSPLARRLRFSHRFADVQRNPLGSVLPTSGMHSREGSFYYTSGSFWRKQEWNPTRRLASLPGQWFSHLHKACHFSRDLCWILFLQQFLLT